MQEERVWFYDDHKYQEVYNDGINRWVSWMVWSKNRAR